MQTITVVCLIWIVCMFFWNCHRKYLLKHWVRCAFPKNSNKSLIIMHDRDTALYYTCELEYTSIICAFYPTALVIYLRSISLEKCCEFGLFVYSSTLIECKIYYSTIAWVFPESSMYVIFLYLFYHTLNYMTNSFVVLWASSHVSIEDFCT